MEDPAKRRPSGTPLDGNRSKSVDRKKDTEPEPIATMSQADGAEAGGGKGPSSKSGADKSQDKDAEVPSEPREPVVMGKRAIHARSPDSHNHPLFIHTYHHHLHHPKRAAAAAAAAKQGKVSSDLKLVNQINNAAKNAVNKGCMDADGKKRIKWGNEGVAAWFQVKPSDKDRAVSDLLESHLDQLQKLEDSVARNICMRFVDLREVKLPGAK